MNRLLGLVKLRLLIEKNINRNMSLMDTDKNIDVMKRDLEDFGHMDFFDSYHEFEELIKNLKNNEKRVLLSMAREQSLENYFCFNYIKSNDMLVYIEKKNDRVKCTFNKKRYLKKEIYEKRSSK